MKILLVSNLYPPDTLGGAEQMVALLAGDLAARGHEVHVVTRRKSRGTDETSTHDGVRVHRFWPGFEFFPNPARPGYFLKQAWIHVQDLRNTRALQALSRLCLELRPDIIHTHNLFGLSIACWKTAAVCGVPIIHTCHDAHLLHPTTNLPPDGRPNAVYSRIYLTGTRLLSALTAPSPSHLAAHQRAGSHARLHAMVPNGLPPPATAVQPRVFSRKPAGLFLGRLEPHKGLDLLLKAVDCHLPENIEVRVAGAGRMEAEVQRVAARKPNLLYLGHLDANAKSRVLNDADFIIHPSRCPESFGLSILEGYQHGRPAVVSNLGGQSDLVQDGVTGFRFESGNAESLASRILELTRQQDQGLQFSKNCLAEAAKFSVAKMADTFLSLYQCATNHGP